jgi:pyruvate dehydrogenase E2 component (dihydrolipoamide acetyltransferase)
MERVVGEQEPLARKGAVAGRALARSRPQTLPRLRRERTRGWRRIASAMWRWPSDPQIYGTLEVDATSLLALIERARRDGVPLSITHLVGRALAHALEAVPEVNGRLVGGTFIPHRSVDVFFITAVGGGRDLSGVKVVRSNEKTAREIAVELQRRATALKSGEDASFNRSKRLMDTLPLPVLRPLLHAIAWWVGTRGREVRALGLEASPFGSAMVSSVGMFGLPNGFSPLAWLYRVPVLLLAGEVTDKAWVVEGKVVVRPVVSLNVSLDHRFMDGWHISRLTKAFREYFADPAHYDPDA